MFTNTSPVARLPRRRPPGGELLHGAPDRRRRRARWASTASSCGGATTCGPQQIPYKAASGMTYDSGDFGAVFEKAVQAADVTGFAKRKTRKQSAGKLRGLGHRQLPGGDRAAEQGDGRHPLRERRRRHPRHRHARLRPGARGAVRAGARFAPGRAVRRASAWCRATRDQLVFGAGTGGSRSIDDERRRRSRRPPTW